MPCWMLIITSIGFFIPSIFAARLKKLKDKKMIQALATTSILYHGTVHPLAQFVDTCVAHFVAFRYMIHGAVHLIHHRTIQNTIAMTIGSISAFMYYFKSQQIEDVNESRKWHAYVHVSAQMALIMFLHSPKRYAITYEEI